MWAKVLIKKESWYREDRKDVVGIACSAAGGQELLMKCAKAFVFPPKNSKKAMVFIKLGSSCIVALEDGSALYLGME